MTYSRHFLCQSRVPNRLTSNDLRIGLDKRLELLVLSGLVGQEFSLRKVVPESVQTSGKYFRCGVFVV